jgi:pyrroline-5-carboxylate reductase
MKVSFIGGGNMGEAILAALIRQNLSEPGDIFVSDAKEERREYLKTTYAVHTSPNNHAVASKGQVVILAVKPQNLAEVMSELTGKLNASQLVLSIIAGKSLTALRAGLNHEHIVRAMPNTPAQIGQGMTVWTALPEVNETQNSWAKAILGVMGQEVYAADEGLIDMATAVSGSGPAYVFLFMESLLSAAQAIGLPEKMAQEMVFQTLAGSVAYAAKSGKDLAELRRMVTSPGGTTAEALKVFEQGDFAGLVKKAVAAAYRRAKELGDKTK